MWATFYDEMKQIFNILLCCTLALCEVPPPYPQRGFRPSPQIFSQSSNTRHPQTTYGPPSKQTGGTLNVQIPSKLTIEQLIRFTEQLQSSQSKIVNRPQKLEVSLAPSSYFPSPQQTYGPPSQLQISQLRPPSVSQPQINYGPPQASGGSQGLPNKLQRPQNQYGPPQAPSEQNVPHSTYGVPSQSQSSNSQVPPATSYGVPDIRNLETFEEQRTDEEILRQNLLNDLKKQHLPYKPSAGFKPQQGQSTQTQIQPSITQEYLPATGGSSGQQPQGSTNPSGSAPGVSVPTNVGGNNVGQNYLPPQNTPRSVTRTTTPRPSLSVTTPETDDGSSNSDYDYDLQPTSDPTNQEGSEGGPNISISTAVAGPGGFFYLQQPDGRLQRVVVQKTQEQNSKPEEYVANYYFQNVQALPDTAYTPLITLGSFIQK